MENCVFCKIIAGVIPSPRFYEDDKMIVIKDVEPKAKLHYLCIPKQHFALLPVGNEEEFSFVAHCVKTIPTLQEKLGLQNGYRLIINQGEDGGQTVHHLHIHLLGGETLKDF